MKTLVVFMTMMFFAVPAIAETYIWEDERGTVNFSGDLGNVPKKYRKKARIVGGEEPPSAEAKDEKEKPAARQQADSSKGEAVPVSGKSAPAPEPDKKVVYGGKDADVWKSEFGAVKAELKAAESQLAENRDRLKDTSGMSRQEYLSINNTIKHFEYRVLELRKKLDGLKRDAAAADVPAELMNR